MPFTPDPNVAMEYGGVNPPGATGSATTSSNTMGSGFIPDPTVSYYAPRPKSTSLLKRIGQAVIQPAVDYGKMVGEGAVQAGRVLTDAKYRNVVQKVNTGIPLTQEEADYVLAQKPGTFIKTPQEWAEFGGAKPLSQALPEGMLEGAKRSASFGAYFAPSLIGGAGAAGAAGRAAITLPTQGLSRAAAAGTLGAARGALSGAMLGFGESERGKELKGTASGAAFGAAVGGAMGYGGSKLAQGGEALKAKAQKVFEQSIRKPVNKMVARVGASMLQMPKRKAWSDMNPNMTVERLMNQGVDMSKFKTLQDMSQFNQEVIGELDDAVDEAIFRNPQQNIRTDTIFDAARRAMAGRNIPPKEKQLVMQSLLEAQTMPIGQFDDMFADDFLKTGLGYDEATTQQIKGLMNKIAVESTGNEDMLQKLWYGLQQDTGLSPDDAKVVIDWVGTSRLSPAGTAKLWDVRKMEQLVNDNATDAYKQWLYSGKSKDKAIFNAYRDSARELKRLLDAATSNTDAVADAVTPERVEHLNALAPGLGDTFAKSPTVGGWRYLMSPHVQAKNMVRIIEREGRSAYERMLERGMGSISGAIAGSAIGGIPGSIVGLLAGTTIAPVAAPILEAAGERLRVPLSGAAARGIHSAMTGGIPAAAQSVTGSALSTAGRALAAPISQVIGQQALKEIGTGEQLRKIQEYNRNLPVPIPEPGGAPSPYDVYPLVPTQ